MIKSDGWIVEMCREREMISPFCEEQIKDGKISFGPSSYGYDIRVADIFKIPSAESKDRIIDPKNFDTGIFDEVKADHCIISAGSYILARSLEYFKIPRDVLTICFGKSTYARCGVVVNVTPLEPEWEGYITMAICNASGFPVKIYANEGIAQILFIGAAQECLVSYKDKKGKYQSQDKITVAKV